MQDAETRALVRALAVLLVVSAVRWVSVVGRHEPSAAGASVLPELTAAVEEAAEEEELRSRPLGEEERIDPNRAAEAELDRLPGVGPATAAAIVAARDAGARFRRPEDLEAVRGIGPKSVERIRAHLDLSDPPPPASRRSPRSRRGPLDLNRATKEELQALPGIGPAIAERVVSHRRLRPFRAVDDLLRVRGIGPATLERLRGRVRVGGRR